MLALKKGSIILITLWILTILVVLSISLNYRMGLEVRLAGFQRDTEKAFYLAKAGVENAVLAINSDQNKNLDTLNQCGITFNRDLQLNPEVLFRDVPLGEGSFSIAYGGEEGRLIYGVVDEERKININKVMREKIMGGAPDEKFRKVVENLFDYADVPSPKSMVSVFIDWIDEDSNSMFASDADDTDYVKNAPLDLPEELLNVLEYFYFREKNYTKKKAEEEAVRVFTEIKDLITVYGSGKININTAGPQVLSILGMDKDLIQDIILFRTGEDGDIDTEEDNGWFVQAAEGADIILYPYDYTGRGPDIMDINNPQYKEFLTTKSSAFTICSRGKLKDGRVKRTITCVVSREQKKSRSVLKYWQVN